jgi:two-component system OmpR family response regulator
LNAGRVLVVDDERDFSSTLSKVLSRRGYAVDSRLSGRAALAALAETAFEAVVLDVRMPGMQGREVLDAIRRAAPATQVILMTGDMSEGAEEAARGGGAFAYLLKPTPIPNLVAVLDAAIARARQPGGGASPGGPDGGR